MKRHVGKLVTGQEVTVVFMELPDDRDQALVAINDRLPSRVANALRDAVDSVHGQQAVVLADVLHTKRMNDDGKSILMTLHQANGLVKVPHNQVVMFYEANQAYPLSDIVSIIREQKLTPAPVAPVDEDSGPKPLIETVPSDVRVDSAVVAARLVEDAHAMLEQAYQLNPELRPKSEADETKREPAKRGRKPKAAAE